MNQLLFRKQTCWRPLALLLLFVFCVPFGWTQSDKGRITGTVTDKTGAVISGAEVQVTNRNTGVAQPLASSDERGSFQVFDLPIGVYSVRFTKDGFKMLERSAITVSVGQVVHLDAQLEPGTVTETVVINSDASLLQIDTSTHDTTLNHAEINLLPLTIAGGRDITNFAFNIIPTVNGTNWASSIAGSQVMSKSITIDGTDADAGLQGTQPPPGAEAIQQFQVETSGISSESAQTGGGSFNYELKSGTNNLHGSVFGFQHNEALDANTWSNNYFLSYCKNTANQSSSACGVNYKRARNRFHDWGFSAGGPLWRNHTFVFGAFEGYGQKDMRLTAPNITLPTDKMLSGDFSEQLAKFNNTQVTDNNGNKLFDKNGKPIYEGAIFNPADPGAVFVGNVIPDSAISQQSKKVIALYKQHYQKGKTSNLTNNFPSLSNGAPIQNNTHVDLKLDHNFSLKNRISVSYNWYTTNTINAGDGNTPWEIGSDDGGPFTGYQRQHATSREFRINDTHTFSSNVLNTLSVNYNEWFKRDGHSANVNTSSLGFTNQTGTATNMMPQMNFSSPGSLGFTVDSIGGRFNDYPYIFYQWHWKDSLTWVNGRHAFKFGGEWSAYGANGHGSSGQTTYTFSNSTGLTTLLNNDANAKRYVGAGFANFMTGYVNGATRTVGTALIGGQHGRRKGMHFFAQDDFKATSRLTLNLGLRWDINLPYKETRGYWPQFDLSLTNESWAPTLRSYGLSGTGAYGFLTSGDQSWEKNNNFHQFGPHIGAAYKASNKIVLRGAYGLFYVPLGINQWGALPYTAGGGSGFGYVGSDRGPTVSDPTQSAFQWDQNVYPGVYTAPTKNTNANAVDFWSTGSSYINPDRLSLGRTQNWNASLQYEVSKNTVIDFTYMGTHGSDLHEGDLDPRNYPTRSRLQPLINSGHDGDWISSEAGATAASKACNCTVPWLPFMTTATNGWGGYNALGALSPYPQTSSDAPILFVDSPLGVSNYNAFIVEVKKRASHGLAMDASYTYSRSTGNTVGNQAGNQNGGNMAEGWINSSAFQDPYAYNSSEAIGTRNAQDIPHQVRGYFVYELPFGHGRKWLSHGGLVDAFAGGWHIGSNFNYRSGNPMPSVWNGFQYGGGGANLVVFANVDKSAHKLSNTFKSLNLASPATDANNMFFNPKAFTNVERGKFGNQKKFFDDWRGWATYSEDASIVKSFGIGPDGKYKATIRAEFFDVLNRHYWGGPDTSINNPTFGHVTSVSGNRTGQFGARFEW